MIKKKIQMWLSFHSCSEKYVYFIHGFATHYFIHGFATHEIYRGYSMCLLNMAYILSSEVETIYISWVAKPRIKYTYFHFTSEIEAICNRKITLF